MAKLSQPIFALREAIHELKRLSGPVIINDNVVLTTVINVLVNALEAIERELTKEDKG